MRRIPRLTSSPSTTRWGVGGRRESGSQRSSAFELDDSSTDPGLDLNGTVEKVVEVSLYPAGGSRRASNKRKRAFSKALEIYAESHGTG